ncbi:transglutaminase-like domain-containing protein [Leptolyngbya sp. Heron Island J]|uniref:transglutaminase-like domain-containing protein n=1 Tax=Leptolyngbya sp. Heron Island J TaxID=1385935 RepID=UPI001F3D6176|nr:transglutaminase family protein [Leptolyngbya sp. Heron Island J]
MADDSTPMVAYLQATDIIDWPHPAILDLAQELAADHSNPTAIAQACFEWVRDRIRHSVDYQLNPVTCRASEVLHYRTGYCYAKSHLLAALLRANQIPAGFCYQRLSVDDQGAPYCLHGLNAVYLPDIGWYRVDARGNREGVDAQFTPPYERLAFELTLVEEKDFPGVLPEPLEIVVDVLQRCSTWDGCLQNLPDVSPEAALRLAG